MLTSSMALTVAAIVERSSSIHRTPHRTSSAASVPRKVEQTGLPPPARWLRSPARYGLPGQTATKDRSIPPRIRNTSGFAQTDRTQRPRAFAEELREQVFHDQSSRSPKRT